MNKPTTKIVRVKSLNWAEVCVLSISFAILQCITIAYLSTKPKGLVEFADSYVIVIVNKHRYIGNINFHHATWCEACKGVK